MSGTNPTYMLDTTEFNRLLDGQMTIASVAGLSFLVTPVQEAQLAATKCAKRRAALLAVHRMVAPSVLPASSFMLDVSGAGFDQAFWNDGNGTAEKMFQRLQRLDKKSKKKAAAASGQWADVAIAETAIKNGAILVSHDLNLRKIVSEFGGRTIDRFSAGL